MTVLQAIVMALLQGVTELFPVSSLGHAVILPRLLRWGVDQTAPDLLPYLVVMHLGTAIALLAYFWRDWIGFPRSLLSRSGTRARVADRRIFLFVVLATIPAVVVGFGSPQVARRRLRSPWIAALFLVVNGAILFFGDRVAGQASAGWSNSTGRAPWRSASRNAWR